MLKIAISTKNNINYPNGELDTGFIQGYVEGDFHSNAKKYWDVDIIKYL